MQIRLLNSNTLSPKTVTFKSVNLGANGFYNLAENEPALKNAKSIEIAYYNNMQPQSAINVYANFGQAYIFGSPNVIIGDLIIRYWI